MLTALDSRGHDSTHRVQPGMDGVHGSDRGHPVQEGDQQRICG